MVKIDLKAGDVILIDFDGFIVDTKKPDGTYYYPEVGPIKPQAKEFLTLLKKTGVIIEIWSARTNYHKDTEKFPMQGHKAMIQIHEFMIGNQLPYDSILMTHKPIGQHYAKYLFDDSVWGGEPEDFMKMYNLQQSK